MNVKNVTTAILRYIKKSYVNYKVTKKLNRIEFKYYSIELIENRIVINTFYPHIFQYSFEYINFIDLMKKTDLFISRYDEYRSNYVCDYELGTYPARG